MASVVSICNRALAILGAKTIVSLDDSLVEAEVMKAIYDDARDSVLREAKPACATFRTTLAKIAEAPSFGYSSQFQLPVSPYCLAVLNTKEGVDYIVEDRKILTDASTCNIQFVGRITDAGVFDAATSYAISMRCAAEASYALSQNRALTQDMWALAEDALMKAQNADAMERGSDPITVQAFSSARS
tara:strand:- start:1029 stop:1589 length:561 start_codon:yes stop_codon:yes gene_type:complete